MEEKPYTHATLCFPIRGDEVLVAVKQKKIGAGLLNGFGGKKEPDDVDIDATNAREVDEEIGIRPTAARKVGEVIFHNPSDQKDLKRVIVHVFIATAWEGEPKETDEMKKPVWLKIDSLDYGQFLAADRLFLPQIFAGKCVKGEINYHDDWSVKSSRLEEVASFDNE